MLAGARVGVAPCPACATVRDASDVAVAALARAFRHEEVRRVHAERSGICVPHGLRLIGDLPRRDALAVADRLRARLDGTVRVRTLAGADRDAPARSAIHGAAAAGLLAAERRLLRRSVRALLEADLREPCCPVCRTQTRTAWGHLAWLLEGRGTEDVRLCGRHLHDLASIDTTRAEPVVAAVAADQVARLDRFTRRLGDRGSRGEAVAALVRPTGCRTCTAEDDAARRVMRLLTAALADDDLNTAYGRSHGVCLHHALVWDGSLPARIRDVLAARIALTGYELSEARRKADWNTRFEPRGAEMSSWSRAPTLLDGRIHCGCPGPEGEPTTP